MSKSLKGKVAVVTGSTSGIGLGIADMLAGSGCDVVLNGLVKDPSEAEQIASELSRKWRTKVRFHPANMLDPQEISDMIGFAKQELGGADILVNNAGIQHTDPVEAFPKDKWDAIIGINLSSCFHSIQAALPVMRERGWGRIINIASTHGLVASRNKAAYVAAKHGLIGLTKVVALETAEENITCNAICPGWVRTPLVEAQISALAERESISHEDAARKLLAEKQPSLRFTEVEDLGAMAVFLAGDNAANMTGAILTADGGWTAQ
ncbi:MAG: 3-hydroxybutyrate dehydrogenase [Cyanobacteriota/Melainabacteria group bacterium]